MKPQSMEPVQPPAAAVRLARPAAAKLAGGDDAVTCAERAGALDELTALSEEMGLYG